MPTGTNHAGDLSPAEAMQQLSENPKAVLVDVRTTAEWDNVGVPDLSSIGGKPVFLEWATAPAMAPNPAFADDLATELEARGADRDTPIFFLCRSGARSGAAARAMTALGYTQSYNVAGGFEGSPAQGLPGWRRSGLPSSGG
jgi:rhodanese-related sulfurtransferase